jgi:hypothetical protein
VAAPPIRAERPIRRRRRLALGLGLLLIGAAAAAAAVFLTRDDARPQAAPASAATQPKKAAPAPAAPLHVAARDGGRLSAPLQDAAAAAVGRRVLLVGGLDAADTSTADIRLWNGSRARTIGRVEHVFHDAGAVVLGGAVYVFGGGDGGRQLDAIVRVDPASGVTSTVGRLPAPSSDQSSAVAGGTAYVVGGYTGSRWLSTVAAWRPGTQARVVAHLPTPVRYAAVAAVGDKVVIAGGSLPDGSADRAVYVFDAATRRVRRIGRLPAPTTHAAAAALGGRVLVIGGRGAAAGTASSRVVAVDPASDRIRSVGRLPRPVSDAAAVGLEHTVVVAGGRGTATLADVVRLVPARRRIARASTRVVDVYAHDRANALSPAVRGAPRVYVPNSAGNTVDVIDQRTFKIVAHYPVGRLPQHVTPSYDLKTLWVDNDEGNSLTPVSPITGRPKGRPVPVADAYNLYFTPSGRYAIVVAERNGRLDSGTRTR